MRGFIVILVAGLLGACSGGSFVERAGMGQPDRGLEPELSDTDQFDPDAPMSRSDDPENQFDDPDLEKNRTISPEDQVELEDTTAACLDAVDGYNNGVIEVSEGEFDLNSIPDGATLLIRASERTVFRLRSEESISLQGLCVFASGQTNMSLELQAEVENAVYIVRGQANTKLDFSGNGALKRLAVDTDGPSNLTLVGDQVACQQLQYQAEGPHQIVCNQTVIQ